MIAQTLTAGKAGFVPGRKELIQIYFLAFRRTLLSLSSVRLCKLTVSWVPAVPQAQFLARIPLPKDAPNALIMGFYRAHSS